MKIKNNVNSGFKGKLEDFNDLQPVGFKAPYHSEITKKSILERGFVQPFAMCEINGELFICDGHLRKDLIYELINDGHQVPDEFSYYLIEVNNDRKKAIDILFSFNTKTNPIDIEVLTEWVNIEQVEVEVTSLNVVYLTDIEETEVLEAHEDDFDSTPPETPITVLGDLYEIGEHRLLCGDSTDSDQVAKLMNGQKADMVFTDPPYGMFLDTVYAVTEKVKGKKYDKVIGDNKDFSPELINTIFACFSDTKEIFIWGADYFAELIPEKNKGSWVVWDKKIESLDKSIGSAFELCWSKQKHKREIVRILWNGFTAKEKNEKRTHPTQKPIKLATFFFDNWGKQNDLVADLYLGSGTTMVASHQLKRKCYGMELDPKYCDVIVKRMIKLDPKLKVKKNGIDETKKWLDKL